MAKAVLVTYAIALLIGSLAAYKQECAVGPQYWCQSFQNAEDCGALRHCTDTVWRYDAKHTNVDSSTTCEWCQKILENTHKGIQHLANNEDLLRQSLAKGCELFPLASVSSKCTNVVEKYGTSAASLMNNKRYATLCHLMNICTDEPVTEKPKMLGQNRCTWGPSYWCSSLSNTRECSSMDHCSAKVWSAQSIEKKPSDNICQYCEFTIRKLRLILQNNKTEINIEKWLAGACSMLQSKDAIDECVERMSQYAQEILVLVQTNIDPGVICHLTHMCKDATIITRVQIESDKPEEKKLSTVDDSQSRMLCNVVVRATHDLHVNQQKNREDIQTFLKSDCQKLANNDLIRKCDNLVEKHGTDIYGFVASHVELSKICDYIDNTAVQVLPQVHCELCTFVMSTAKYMLNDKHTEDKVLRYIDEQVCSRFTDQLKKNCKDLLENHGKDLIEEIKCGTKSILVCARFQVCIDQLFQKPSPVSKDEMQTFVKENMCDNLGSLKDVCNAVMEKDSKGVLKTLINDLEGDTLCQMFGICPKKLSFRDNMAINDDKNKCQRCVDDFTRRKHIAEKLVNHSSEFLHHLCGQLPQKDDCIKTVDESINELVIFVRSLDPQEICVQLKYCNETLMDRIKPAPLTDTDDLINFVLFLKKDTLNCTLCKLAFESLKKALTTNGTEQQIIRYVQDEICSKLGALSELCKKTIESEGPALIGMISKDIDPKTACATMGICSGFENCNDKCECCMDQMEIHEVQLATFLREMVGSIKDVCGRMPGTAKCHEMTSRFDANVNKITSSFNAKRVCQLLNHCSTPTIEIETLTDCQSRVDSKKQFLLSSLSSINDNLKSLCEYIPWNKDCHSLIDRSTLDIHDKLTQLKAQTVCASGQSLADSVCTSNSPFEKLCKQLVDFDENHSRMEALFKSMFNTNGRLEKELCELDQENLAECKTSFQLNNCKDKCDCCVQFYTTKKTYDLNMIETLRSGLLASCDWSLTKDYCVSWFNRVCDRMKAKVDQFVPTSYCKRTGFCPIGEQTNNQECQMSGDKCQCCTNRLNLRQNRFRTILDELTTSLLSSCSDNDCRSMVQSAQQQSLSQVDKIDSPTLCKRYGYCQAEHSSDASTYMARLLSNSYRHLGSAIEALDQRLEMSLTSDICFQFGQLRPMCEQLIASPQNHRYGYVYMALLKNNPKIIDDDLREQMTTKVNADVCASCKNAVQSSKDFWDNALDTVRDVLLRSCERCPSKDQCRSSLTQRFDNLKSYVNSIDADQFCQSLRLCSSSSALLPSEIDPCSTCVQTLQSRKETLLQAVDRMAAYFDDVCQRFGGKQCQTFVQQIQQSFKESIETYDVKQTCALIGFCSRTSVEGEVDFETYEKYLEDELDKTVCSTMGPFESLCKQVIRGNRKQVETVKMNYNIKDLMQLGEQLNPKMTNNFFTATNLNACSADKCQCCIDRVKQKKEVVKNLGDKVVQVLTRSCDYCPSKDQCRDYWQGSQSQFDSYIDSVCPKKLCMRFGFCNASTLCANMGVFQQSCEEALAAFTQSIENDPQTLEDHLPHTSVVVLPVKHQDEEKQSIDILSDSNATCILCEYMMNILATYIHSQSTETEIEQSLQKVCNQMPSTLRQQCHDLVNNYGPPIIATLLRDFDVTTICRKLNLCTSQMKVQLNHITKANVATCSMCDYVSTYIHFALKRDPSEKSLQHALSTVCTHLSNEQNSQCQTLVQLFAPQIRKLDLQLGNNFCKQLTICQTEKIETDAVKPSIVHVPLTRVHPTKETDELKRTIIQNLDETPECLLCHYVVSYLDAILKNNKSEAAVEAALEKVCTILPTKERATCDQFVKTYGPVLAELIAEAADPDTICRYLGVCQVSLPTTIKPVPVTYGNHDYARLPSVQTPFTCTICQFVFSKIKHVVTTNKTEEEILAAVKESCDLFSVINLKQQCKDFLDQYASYIIQMVASDVEPKVACQNLGVCEKSAKLASTPSTTRRQSTPASASAAPSSVYGKCVYGMNYWCTSRQNAILCNAVELCEREVWSKKNKNIVI